MKKAMGTQTGWPHLSETSFGSLMLSLTLSCRPLVQKTWASPWTYRIRIYTILSFPDGCSHIREAWNFILRSGAGVEWAVADTSGSVPCVESLWPRQLNASLEWKQSLKESCVASGPVSSWKPGTEVLNSYYSRENSSHL